MGVALPGHATISVHPAYVRCYDVTFHDEVPRDPIEIDGNANFTAAKGVTAGDGSEADPYIIENWVIFTAQAHGVVIRNTSLPFVIRDIALCGSSESVPQYDGIRLRNVTNATIESSRLAYHRVHVSLENVTDVRIAGVYVAGQPWFVEPVTSIAIRASNASLLDIEKFDDEWGYGPLKMGVELADAHDVLIRDSAFHASRLPVSFTESSNVTIAHTQLGVECARGMSSSDIVIDTVNFDMCLGLQLEGVRNVTVRASRFVNNGWGLALVSTVGAIIERNTFLPPDWGGVSGGFWAHSSRDVLVVNNSFRRVYNGVWLEGSTNVRVHHNLFDGNQVQAYDDRGEENQWDDGYPAGGNYWSDYDGVDCMRGPNQNLPGPDGIGDTPYDIDEDSRDRYPLYLLRYEQYRGPPPVPLVTPDVRADRGPDGLPEVAENSHPCDHRPSIHQVEALRSKTVGQPSYAHIPCHEP